MSRGHFPIARPKLALDIRPMPSPTLKEKVEKRLAELGRNPFEAARLGELERGFVNDLLQGKKSTVKGENLIRLARGLDWTVNDLLDAPPAPMPRHAPSAGPDELVLPIRYEVAAGAWQATDEVSDEPLGYAAAPRLKGFERWSQWYERVVGDSYNRRIPEGALVHVVDAIEMGYEPRHGDTVIVQRTRAQGSFRERTLKQVEVTPAGVLLRPQSFNPKWAEPLDLSRDMREGDDGTVEIVGKVLRAYIGFEDSEG